MKIVFKIVRIMHTLQSTRDFSATSTSSAPSISNKSANMKNCEQPKSSDEKSLDKPRPPSAGSSSAVKPPYSYIALSNYLITSSDD